MGLILPTLVTHYAIYCKPPSLDQICHSKAQIIQKCTNDIKLDNIMKGDMYTLSHQYIHNSYVYYNIEP